jgi:hypothetical protein
MLHSSSAIILEQTQRTQLRIIFLAWLTFFQLSTQDKIYHDGERYVRRTKLRATPFWAILESSSKMRSSLSQMDVPNNIAKGQSFDDSQNCSRELIESQRSRQQLSESVHPSVTLPNTESIIQNSSCNTNRAIQRRCSDHPLQDNNANAQH